MRQRVDDTRAAINIAPETLHQMMAIEYAEGFASPGKRSWREGLLWRTIKWTSLLVILIFAGLVIYAVKFVDHDVRQQDDVDRILTQPPGASLPGAQIPTASFTPGAITPVTPVPSPLSSTASVPVPALTSAFPAAGSLLLAATAPSTTTSSYAMTATLSHDGAPISVQLEVLAYADGSGGRYTVTTPSGSYMVIARGADIAMQAPDGTWYQGPLDARTSTLMWPFDRRFASPQTLGSLLAPVLTRFATIERLDTTVGQVTNYRLLFDTNALTTDPAAVAAYDLQWNPTTGAESRNVGIDATGVVKNATLRVNEAGISATVQITYHAFGAPMDVPVIMSSQPLPADLPLPI